MQLGAAEMKLQVSALRAETADILSLQLANPTGGPLPAFTPGAHIALRLGKGLVRQYSLCNGPEDGEAYFIAVKREAESRGGSAAVHRLGHGDLVAVTPPVNAFPVDWSAPHLVLLAGGIGITPLLSMARHAQQRGHSFELHYFARSFGHAAFRDLLGEGRLAPHVTFHFGVEPAAMDRYLRDLLASRRTGSNLYLCGPTPFMDRARAVAADCSGLCGVRWEYFTPSHAADPVGDQATPFTVRLARSGRTFEVPADKTVLQILLANDVEVDSSCMEGVCGLCATRVLEGEPDHRDEVLSDEEKRRCDVMTVCVSRARGRLLVLDL
jgi:vanillate O-demethylase ferredoxin subunit